MSEFGGYQMPIQYNGVKQEHLTVRNSVGVFDVSHMGEFIVEGENALSFLQYICSNDLEKLNPGKAQYNYFPNNIGGIVDDLIVYQLESEKYLLVVNASNIDKDWQWVLARNENFNADICNVSDQMGQLAIQGPKAISAMKCLTPFDLSSLSKYTHVTKNFADCKGVLISRTGYTGADGIEIYFKPAQAIKIWIAVMEAGKSFDIQPIGLAARDTLRLEMGYCLYGNEINDTRSPISAGLGWVTKTKTNFLNAKLHQKAIDEGTPEKLVGFEIETRGIPRTGYLIFDKNKQVIGKVTSGTQSPSLNKGIGIGYVKSSHSAYGSSILVKIRDKFLPAKVLKTPFFKYK
jgi:aminomethyltransferase